MMVYSGACCSEGLSNSCYWEYHLSILSVQSETNFSQSCSTPPTKCLLGSQPPAGSTPNGYDSPPVEYCAHPEKEHDVTKPFTEQKNLC